MNWATCDKKWTLQGVPKVMGILNVTPDSFSDGGSYVDVSKAVERALEMVEEGADLIDIGGESTRPNAVDVDETEELRRVLPVIEALAFQSSIPLSIDTRKVRVAREAVQAGAVIINDVEANREDPSMWEWVAESGVGYVAMHMQGSPGTMQQNPHYGDVFQEVVDFFKNRLDLIFLSGVKKEQVMLDVGIGFGKTLEHNLDLLRSLESFQLLGHPLLLGVSRKSMFQSLLGIESPSKRVPAGLACACWAMQQGVGMIRTHDVEETVHALKMWDALQS
jgi:dihydropteroate synthase